MWLVACDWPQAPTSDGPPNRCLQGDEVTSARYYACVLDEKGVLILPPTGPFPTYSHAVDVHAKYLADQDAQPFPAGWPLHGDRRRVLLDLGSVTGADHDEMQQLLLHDPVLRAVFQLGRMSGVSRADSTEAPESHAGKKDLRRSRKVRRR
jgi:hypothetical protein